MNIYFSGIGGVAIGPLAMLAQDAGHHVSGSDQTTSEMITLLQQRSVTIYSAQDGSQIAKAHQEKPIDWFIYTSALQNDHPELNYAHRHGIKISKRHEFINEFLNEKQLKLIAVAGTHGKTTTTGMLVWAFKELRVPASYSVGTTLSFGPPAQYQTGAKYFIYECDEFDKNFLHFKPEISLITSYDFDHPDTYPTKADYKQAFLQFISQSNHSNLWQRDADSLGLESSETINILNNNSQLSDIKLPGLHVRQNAKLALNCLLSLNLSVSEEKLVEIINNFPGTKRRFEKLDENLYTDYAHHPAEITATIELARELNPNVVVIYQPHQNIRQHDILEDGGYKDSFSDAKKVYWLPTYLSREYTNLPQVSMQELIDSNSNPDNIQAVELNDQLWNDIKTHQQNGDLVLAMSAGDLDSWLRLKL